MPPRLNTTRIGAIAALASVSLGCCTAVAPAVAKPALSKPAASAKRAPSARGRAKIASPSANALISSTTVPVRVTVSPKVTGIKVFAGTKDVSKRFTRRGNSYVARLPRSVVKTGKNTLVVQALSGKAAGGADISTFIVDKPAASASMSVSNGAKAAASMARSDGYTPTQGAVPVAIHTAKPMFAKVRVNGRRFKGSRDFISMRDHSWLLSPSNGLRPGRNTIKVESYDTTGAHTTKTFTVNRDKSLPLTRTGPNERTVRGNTWTRLDASKSRAARRGDGLAYAWRVVKAPTGAKPVLRNATSAKPQFKPDKPGTYKLALRATTQRKGVAGAAALGAAAEDAVTIDAPAATLGHQGLYVGTDLEHGSDPSNYATLYYDGMPYAASDPSSVDIALRIDPTTLAVDPDGVGTVESIKPEAGKITIYDWSNHTVSGQAGTFGSQVYIGTDMVANNHTDAAAPLGNGNSNLHGWLQPASADTGSAKWIPSDYLQVQTRNAGEASNQNTMTVNDWPHTVTLPDGATGGFEALGLDNEGHPFWVPDAYALTGDAGHDTDVENQLASDLQHYAGPGSTLLLQGFGKVNSMSDGSALGNELQALGGRADTAFLLNGTPDANGGAYALISSERLGSNTAAWSGAEASANRMGGGTLTALLTRDPNADDYMVMQSDHSTPDATRYRFTPELWAAPTSFDGTVRTDDNKGLRSATPSEQAALAAIAAYASSHDWTSETAAACPNQVNAIRASYCDIVAQDLQNLKDNVNGLTYATATSGVTTPGYSQADFAVAQSTYVRELADVASLRADISAYQGIYGADGLTAAFSADTIGQDVQRALDTSAVTNSGTSTTDPLDGLQYGLGLMGQIPEVGDVFSFLSAGIQLAQMSGPNDDQPVPALPHQVELDAANAGSTIGATYEKASDDLSRNGDYMVEDPQKLITNAYDMSKGDLALTTDRSIALKKAAAYGMREYLWGAILGGSYANWTGVTDLKQNPMCSMDVGDDHHPFSNMDDSGHWLWHSPTTNGGIVHWWIGEDQDREGPNSDYYIYSHDAVGLPKEISQKLFGPVDPTKDATDDTNNVGAIAPYFQLRYLPTKPLSYVHAPYGGIGCWPY
jgi:hypothetical protein